jgi:hypothetical protein
MKFYPDPNIQLHNRVAHEYPYVSYWFGPGDEERKKHYILKCFLDGFLTKTRVMNEHKRRGRYSHSMVIVGLTPEFSMFMLKHHSIIEKLISAEPGAQTEKIDDEMLSIRLEYQAHKRRLKEDCIYTDQA